jgi:adenylosuccinate synthase
MTTFELILDCQYGSTGKGLFAGYLAQRHQPDVLAMAPSPNAGHTLVDGSLVLIHKMLPLGVQSSALRTILLGPGSIIDISRLIAEIQILRQGGIISSRVDIVLHENAVYVTDEHRSAEADGGTAPGSTRQGTGAAQAARVRRVPDQDNTIGALQRLQPSHPLFDWVEVADTPMFQRIYGAATRVQVEGCQGYSLSVYHGRYPYVTCRDVSTAQLLADCAVPMPSMRSMHVHGTFRTYPIRVANRPEAGEWSGPTYPDSKEISFSDLGVPQELTTVTKLPRRVFTFSAQQALEACVQNRIDSAFLNFAQYPPDFKTLAHVWLTLSEYARVDYIGFGPDVSNVYRVGAPGIADQHLRHLYDSYRQHSGAAT